MDPMDLLLPTLAVVILNAAATAFTGHALRKLERRILSN